MRKLLCLILIISVLLLSLTSCNEGWVDELGLLIFPIDDYYKGANWFCDEDAFVTHRDLWSNKVQQLINYYGLVCSVREEHGTNKEGEEYALDVFLYCEEYTIVLEMLNYTECGNCEVILFYYGNAAELFNQEKAENLVHFIRDFINYVAYDTRPEENIFESLYNEALAGNGNKSLIYHEDDYIGKVGYIVRLDSNDHAGYYYMAEKNFLLEDMRACRLEFKGILKPLI